MRWGLGGGVALVALAVWCGAGNRASAQAVRPLQVTVGGYMEQSFGFARNARGVRTSQVRQTGFTSVVLQDPNRFGQQSDTEIWFSGRTTLGNGMVVGFKVELEGNSQFNDQIDESFLFVEGAFGRLVLGSENDAAYLQHVSAPRPRDGWGVLESAVTGWVYTPRDAYVLTTTAPLTTGDDQKITYFSPRLAGLQFGASLTPNDKQDAREFSDRDRDRTNVWTVSANGRWELEGVEIQGSIGWVHGAGVPKASFADRRTPIDDWAVGGLLSYQDWALSAGYRRLRNPEGALDGRAFAAGITRNWAGAAFGASWLRSRSAGLARTPGHDRGDIVLVSAAYPVARGVALIGSAFTARYDVGQSTRGREDRNQGFGLVTGVRLAF